MKVVLTDQVFPSTDVERAILGEAGASLDVLPEASPDAIKKAAKDADGVLTTYAPLDRSTIESLERCKIIARYGIGVDNIDLDAAKERGIAVTNVPDYCVEEVADHTLGLILALTRKVVLGHRFVREGGWGIGALRPVHRLRGRTLGLVGLGHIGEAVAIRAKPLGLKIDIFDPYVDDAKVSWMGGSLTPSLHELLATCHIASIHVPLTEETRGMIDEQAVSLMPRGSFLVNTSRGPIVDVHAVVSALRSDHLGGAALDVLPSEPPTDLEAFDAPNLIMTPHSAFYSEEAIQESQTKAATAIAMALRGEEPHYRVA